MRHKMNFIDFILCILLSLELNHHVPTKTKVYLSLKIGNRSSVRVLYLFDVNNENNEEIMKGHEVTSNKY